MSQTIQGVLVGGALSLATAVLLWVLQSRSARRSAGDQREFDRQENRLRDQLDAYVAFAGVMTDAVRKEEQFLIANGISRVEDLDPPDREPPAYMNRPEEALVRLEVLVPALYQAGRTYLDAFYATWYAPVFGRRPNTDELELSRAAFLTAARNGLRLG